MTSLIFLFIDIYVATYVATIMWSDSHETRKFYNVANNGIYF